MATCLTAHNAEQDYLLGSRGEGSTGPGLESDQDIMIQVNPYEVVSDLSECQPGKNNLLMVQDEHTHSGYGKLQTVKILSDNTPVPVFLYPETAYDRVDAHGRVVLSNNRFHDYIAPGDVSSGPAIQQKDDISQASRDSVTAIRCRQWPNESHEWFQRRRLRGWPKASHIQNAKKDGCFVTPVGHPRSCEEDLEWRISFSLTERKLIRSLEDTVMKVYILLKTIKQIYIEPYLDDAFSSYHCKVCILWMREKTPPELWRTENLLYCLTLCIKQLHEWATMGHCPDYFIVTNNIYDRKIVKKAQFKLIWKLEFLLSQDCRFLSGLECCNRGMLLFNACSILDIARNITVYLWTEQSVGYMLCLKNAMIYRSYLSTIPQEYYILTYYIRRIMHILQHAHHTSRIYLHNILMTLLSRLGFYVISVCKENAHCLPQEEVDYLVALASMCLSLGINCDASSARLKLCGLGTTLGYYDLTEICLQHISDHNMNIICMGTLDADTPVYIPWCGLDLFLTKYLTERYSIEQVLLNHMSFSVVYRLSETSITPTALGMEMFRSIGVPLMARYREEHFWYKLAIVDAYMCLYFFKYLNFYKLGKERHQQAAMDNMIDVINTELDIPHRDTELNLLGYCFMRESQHRNAFICFYHSENSSTSQHG